MSENPLSGKIGLDTTDFKTAVSQINRDLRLIETGFRANAATLGNWGRSADGLVMRMDALTGEIELQQTKVQLLKDEYQRIAKEKGENSRAAQNLQIRINRETEALNKNQRELNETQDALDEMGGESEKAGKSAKKMGKDIQGAEKRTLSLKKALDGLSKIGKKVVIGLAAVSLAAGAALAGLAIKTGLMLKDATLAAARFEQLSDVSLVVGKSMGIAEDSVTSTTKALREKGIEAASAAEAVTKMMQADLDLAYATDLAGVAQNAAVVAGENSTETYDAIITAVTTLNTEMLRNRGIVFSSQSAYEDYAAEHGLVASQLTESQKQAAFMNAVIKAGIPISEAYATSMKNPVKILGSLPRVFNDIAVGIGGPFTEGLANIIKPFYDLTKGVAEMVSEGGSLRPILDSLGGSFAAFGENLGSTITSIGPILDLVGDLVSALLGGDIDSASNILDSLVESLLGLFEGSGAAGESGGGVNILNFLIEGITRNIPQILDLASELVLNFVTGILDRLPLLLSAGIEILTALISGILPQLPTLLTAAIGIINTLVQGLLQLLPDILSAALEIVLALANGLIQALPTLVPAIFDILFKLIDTLLDNLPMIIEAAFTLVSSLAEGIADALPELIPTVIEVILQIVTTLLENLPMLIEAALSLVIGLAEGIVAAIPVLIPEIPKIVVKIVELLIASIPKLLVAAVELITALALGLVENLPLLIKAVIDIVKGIIDTFKNTDWKKIGEDLVAGIKEGFLARWGDFKRSITEKFNGLVGGIKGLLGIHSPSTLFAGIGENMAAGLGGGFSNQMDKVTRQIRNTVGDLENGWGFGMGGLQLAPQNASNAQPAPNITINATANNEIDYYRLARRVADEIRKGR